MSPSTYRLVERKDHWLAGSLGALGNDRLRFLADSAQMAPIVRFRLGHRRCYLVSEPDLIHAWYEMARQPAIEAHFHEELDRRLGGRPPSLEDLEQLPYTCMIFKEALRLYPAAWCMVRSAAEPIALGGHSIPSGSMLLVGAFAMHRHPDLWEEPERFDPERFAGNAERDWHRFKYFPFGGGPRACIGSQFALAEGPLILATLGQRYRFELLHPGQRLELEPQITLGPKGGMPMRLRRRQDDGSARSGVVAN